jgi:hypothetical protein
MNPQDRIRAYLAKVAPSVNGQHGHNALLHAASVLVVGFNLTDDEALPFLCEYNNLQALPAWPKKELHRKLKEARKRPIKPYGYLIQGQRLSIPSCPVAPAPAARPKPKFNPDKLAKVAGHIKEPVDATYLRARSKFTCWNRSIAGVLHKLYRPGEKVLVFTSYLSQGELLWEHPGPVGDLGALNPLYRGHKRGAWFLSNPIDGQWRTLERLVSEHNPTGRTRRAEENLTAFRYAVLESDQAPPALWLKALVQLPLRISEISTSGARSIHALVRIDAESKGEWDQIVRDQMAPTLVTLGADPGALTAVRLTSSRAAAETTKARFKSFSTSMTSQTPFPSPVSPFSRGHGG